MMQSVPTCKEEVDVFADYENDKDKKNAYYGKAVCISAYVPYIMVCGNFAGFFWKIALFYALFKALNPLFDCGVYFRFFVNGPGHFRQLLKLESKKSFNSM